MPVVSLNLDARDAAAVRRALAGAVARCGCRHAGEGWPCADCDGVGNVVADLDRFLARATTPSAAAARWSDGSAPRRHLATGSAAPADRGLRLVGGGHPDG